MNDLFNAEMASKLNGLVFNLSAITSDKDTAGMTFLRVYWSNLCSFWKEFSLVYNSPLFESSYL